MQIETLDARTLSDSDALGIAELLVAVWPKPGKSVAYRQEQMLAMAKDYAGPENQAPKCFVGRVEGRIVAHSTFVPRIIGTPDGELTIAGLARVCSHPDCRGQGLGERIVRPVFDLVDDGTFPFSLFQTSVEVRPFYERMGACIVENPIVNSLAQDLHDSPFWDRVVMRYDDKEGWPAGQIDLRGPGY